MKVLIADKFEKVGIDGLKELGCTVVSQPDVKAEELPAAIRADRSAHPHRPRQEGERRRAQGRHRAHPGDPGRRRDRHHRRGHRLEPRRLRLQLSGQELDRGRRAGDGPAARVRPADPRPGGRAAGRAPGTRASTPRRAGCTGGRSASSGWGRSAGRSRRGPGRSGCGWSAWSRSLTHEEADRLGVAYAQTPLEVARLADAVIDQRRGQRRDQAPGERRVPGGDAAGRVPHQHLARLGGGRGGARAGGAGEGDPRGARRLRRTSRPGAPARSPTRSCRRPASTARTTSAPPPTRPRWRSRTR